MLRLPLVVVSSSCLWRSHKQPGSSVYLPASRVSRSIHTVCAACLVAVGRVRRPSLDATTRRWCGPRGSRMARQAACAPQLCRCLPKTRRFLRSWGFTALNCRRWSVLQQDACWRTLLLGGDAENHGGADRPRDWWCAYSPHHWLSGATRRRIRLELRLRLSDIKVGAGGVYEGRWRVGVDGSG